MYVSKNSISDSIFGICFVLVYYTYWLIENPFAAYYCYNELISVNEVSED